MAHGYEEFLPPRELWPNLIYSRPELVYPERLNVASELLDVHVSGGNGNDPAILFEEQRLSYAELQRETNRIGNVLLRLGIQAGDRVMLRIPNRPLFVAAWLAIQKIGAVGVATMPMLRAREIAYVVNDCQASVLLCAADLLEDVLRARDKFNHGVTVIAGPSHSRDEVFSLDELTAGVSDELEAYSGRSDSLALIAYTSGSTGVPKGTTHSPTDILAAADGYARNVLQPTRHDVFGGHPTMAFTFGLGGLLVFPLRFGAATALIDRFSPELLLATAARRRVTVQFCAATTYRILLQDPLLLDQYDLRSLRLCVSAGEILPEPVFRAWRDRTGIEILDGIGATEMFHVFISSRPGEVRPGSTGFPVPGYEAKVVDEQFQDVPCGTPGLLAVRGPTGCRYWRNPELQRNYVRHGWNVTGDVYIRDQDGYFWYQCRNDDLIICGGFNIAGPEVESVLLEHPAVAEVAVVASPDTIRGNIPKAFVVLRAGLGGSSELITELQEHVKREMAPYKYPREIEFVPELPRTETGKIRRVELRARELARKAVAGFQTTAGEPEPSVVRQAD